MLDADSKFKQLEELTNLLPSIPKIEDYKRKIEDCEGMVEYPIKDGTCFSYSLFSSPFISVARTFVSAGGVLPEHKHDEKEIAIVYSGSVMVRSSDDRNGKILKEGDLMVYDPGVVHYLRALEDTWFIAMTIPHSKDYPE